jgi:hypothetical protein
MASVRKFFALCLFSTLGTALFAQFVFESGVIFEYTGAEKDVVVPPSIDGEDVTAIGPYAFAEQGLTSITIPNGVTYIGKRAFAGNQLTEVVIPGSLTRLEDDAFHGNPLKNITIPGRVTYLGDYSFLGNRRISVTIGANMPVSSKQPDDFGDFYNKNGKKAGTYTNNTTGGQWVFKAAR